MRHNTGDAIILLCLCEIIYTEYFVVACYMYSLVQQRRLESLAA